MSGSPPPSRPLVVVVDDTLPVRLMTARTLTMAGYDVLSAPDGAAAVTLMLGLRTPPDLVITDLRMPAMDGEALGRWVTVRYPHVPLVFISGFVPADTGELPGAFLSKPFTPEILLEVVQGALADCRQPPNPSRSGARARRR
jgi:chemosensory pili system protein ChpA (sensor histidine kinase/response regulator)